MTMLFDGEVAASQPARAFCAQNLFYRPMPDRFTQLWDEKGWASAASTCPDLAEGGGL